MSTTQLEFIHRFIPARKVAGSTLLLLHGTGGDETDMVPLGREIAPEAALLSPRGKVLENGMPRFFRRLAEGVFDLEDLTFRTHELASFVEAASTAYGFDLHRAVAVGYSNGANMAASILLLRTRTFAGAVLFRPLVPIVPKELPDLSGIHVFISGGRSDPIVPRQETERLSGLLQQAGAEVKLHWQNGSHGISRDEIQKAKEWFSLHFPR